MSHYDIPELDTRGLRQFGLLLGAFLAIGFGILLPWVWDWKSLPNLGWIGAGIVAVTWAMIAPDSMRGLYKGWMQVAMRIGVVVNGIILAIVFFVVVTPMGIVMRMMRKDPMRRQWDDSAASYRENSKVAARNHVERPY